MANCQVGADVGVKRRQQIIRDARERLGKQTAVERKINALKSQDKSNASTTTGKDIVASEPKVRAKQRNITRKMCKLAIELVKGGSKRTPPW